MEKAAGIGRRLGDGKKKEIDSALTKSKQLRQKQVKLLEELESLLSQWNELYDVYGRFYKVETYKAECNELHENLISITNKIRGVIKKF